MRKITASDAARILGSASTPKKTAAVRKNGAQGGRPGPSLAAQAAVVWTELASSTTRRMTLGARLTAYMLAECDREQIGLTPDSAARLIQERAGKRTSAWITATVVFSAPAMRFATKTEILGIFPFS